MKNTVSTRDFFFIICIMHISTIQITGLSSGLNQDNWIPLLLSLIPIVPVVALFARMQQIMPGKSLYDMILFSLGKAGRVVCIVYALYSVHVISLILCNTSGFAQLNLQKTPQLILMICILLPAVYIAKSGTRTIGIWSFILFILAINILVFNILISFPVMEIGNLMPVFEYPFSTYARDSVEYVFYPFGEVVFLLTIAGDVSQKNKGSAYRCFIGGTIASNLILLATEIRTIAILGPYYAENIYMSSYKALSIAKIGSFLQRLESITGAMLILFGIAKLSICVTAAARGLAVGTSQKENVDYIVPCALVGLTLAAAMFGNNIQIFDFVNVYKRYAPVFQLALPLLIWGGAEVKIARQKKMPHALQGGSAV